MFTFPWRKKKKKQNKRENEKNTRPFVRWGSHARMAPEANRLEVRLNKRGVLKKVMVKGA